jgi:hypothetical protein
MEAQNLCSRMLIQDSLADRFEDDLRALKKGWNAYQTTKDRRAIYLFLDPLCRVAQRWSETSKLRSVKPSLGGKGALVAKLLKTTCPTIDRKIASKWSRAVRYAMVTKPTNCSLMEFMLAEGGINQCAAAWANRARRSKR